MATRRELLIYQVVASGEKQFIADLTTIQKLIQEHQKVAEQSGKAIADAIAKESSAVADLIRQQNELQRTAQTTRQAQLDGQKESARIAKEARDELKAQTLAIQQQNAQYGAMKDQLTGLVGLAVSVFSINAIKNYSMEVIDAKTKVDLFSTSLTMMIGNKKEADEVAGRVFELAKRSPFEVEQLITVTQKLKAMGVETSNLLPYMESLGNMSSVVGKEKLPFIAKAMTDVMGKGTLMRQELNQFTNASIPLFDLLAKSMGKQREEIVLLAEQHKISWKDVEKAILQASEKGGMYYNAMANSAKTLGGQVSNLSDLFFLGKAKVGDYFENGLQKGISIMGDFLKATIGSNEAIARSVRVFEAGIAIIVSYKVAILAMNASLRANQVQTLSSMDTTFAANIAERARIQTMTAGITANTLITESRRASNLALLASMETQIVANGVQTVGTGITASLASATRGLWLAMSANPIGFILSGVGLLIGAYQAFKAVTIDVTHATSEEENMLLKTKVGYETLLRAIANTTVGTEARSMAVARMQAAYPGYNNNINLETASQGQLAKQLFQVNAQLERKIRLAGAEALASELTSKAVDVEKEKLQLVMQLRKENNELSQKFASDETFLFNLQKEQKKQMMVISTSGAMMDNNNTTLRINNYKSLGNTVKGIEDEINKTVNTANQYKARAYKEDYAELKRQLRNKSISVEQYNEEVKKLDDNQVIESKKNGDEVVVNTKKANKAKAESHSLTAKEINLIEAKANADRLDMSKQLSKDEIKVLQDLAKAEYAVDVEKLNKKFKTAKDGKEKISAELIKLDQALFDKLEKIEFDETKKRFAGVELIENKHLTTKELNQKVSLDKQQKAEEKLNAKLEDLTEKFLESQAKLNDAKRLQEELSNAKSATERYAIMVKYGKKTSDELLAMSVARWKQEQALLLVQLKYAEVIYGKDSVQYKTAQEKNLILSTKINDAMTVVITKQADETLRTYGKLYQFYQKHLADSFKLFDESYKNIQELFKKSKDQELSDLQNSLDAQLRLAGTNYQERIRLTEEYAKKEVEILTNANNKDRILGNIRDITAAIGSAFEKESKIYENYQTKTAENAKNGISNAGNTAMSIMQAVGTVVTEVLGASQKARDREFQYQTEINDATQRNYKKHYDEIVNMATQARDLKVKAIEEEERIALASIEKQLSAEIKKLSVLSGVRLEALDWDTKQLLRELDKRYKSESNITDQKIKDEIAQQVKRIEDIQALKQKALDYEQSDREREQLFYQEHYQHLIEQATGNEAEQQRLRDEYIKLRDNTEATAIITRKNIVDKFNADIEVSNKQHESNKTLIAEEGEKERLLRIDKNKGDATDIVKKEQEERDAIALTGYQTQKKLQDDAIAVELATLEAAKNEKIAKANGNADELKAIEEQYAIDKAALKQKADDEETARQTKLYDDYKKSKTAFEDDLADLEAKYDAQKKDKQKQYDDEKADLLQKQEQKRVNIVAIAEQDKVIATNKAEQAKQDISSKANSAILEAEYLYQKALFEGEKAYVAQSLQLQLERNNQQAEYNKATITSNLWVGASNAVANGNAVGGLLGAFNALLNGSDYTNQIEASRATAANSIYAQINANESRQAPQNVSRTKAVKYIRTQRDAQEVGYNGIDAQWASLPDFRENPQASRGHEEPIDYIDYGGKRLGVYDWIASTQNAPNGTLLYLPELQRRYKDGSNYIERGGFKQGIDQIPAMVNEGERILTTEQNSLIGGKDKPNEQVVKEVKFAELVMKRMPNLMEMFDMPRLKMDMPGGKTFDDAKMIEKLENIEKAIANKKNTNVNVNVDKYNVSVQEHTENSRINYRNQIYKRNQTI